jgi:hypothetical protein
MSEVFSISVDGQELFASLDKFLARTSDLRPSWPKVYAKRADHVREQFDGEGGRTGQRWTLSEAYAKRKARTHPGKPVMQREGRLLASLTDRNAEGAIYEERPDRLETGLSLPYALFQFNAGHDLFGEREEDAGEYLEIIADDLTAYARDLGFKA